MAKILTPKDKALKVNLDSTIYGSFAEIGAGQEVVRTFFQAGAAAGTIAKSMSAYDMAMSDAIYGKERSGRYVCEERLQKMLKKEFDILNKRLTEDKYKQTKFFVYADTVATTAYGASCSGHGWIGVRFQTEHGGEGSEIRLHVILHDNQNYLQQEAIGILGTNLIHSCFYHFDSREVFVSRLMDNLNSKRIEIEMIEVEGAAFNSEDARLLNLELIKKEFSQGMIFDEVGRIHSPSEILYKKTPMILRGSFRPPTHVNFDMIKQGEKTLKLNLDKKQHKNVVVLPEISMAKLLERGNVDNEDFLTRVDLLSALGQKVFVTNKNSFFDLNSYLMSLTKENIFFVAGIYNLENIFDISNYKSHTHGMIMGLGELFSRRTKMLVYPGIDENNGETKTAETFDVDPEVEILRQYLLSSNQLIDIEEYNKDYFTIWSREVVKMIENCEPGWEKFVPKLVEKRVKEKSLFGHFCKIN
jgi:hypothetical protein